MIASYFHREYKTSQGMTNLFHLATITLLGLAAAAQDGDVHALLNGELQLFTSTDCGPCTNGCWYTATTPNVGCYAWPKSTCDAQTSAYIWCSSTVPPPAPSPTSVPVTPTKAPTKTPTLTPSPTKTPTQSPTSSTSPSGCGACTGCWLTTTTSNVGCYAWPKSTCDAQTSAYVWCTGGPAPSPSPASTTLKPTVKPTSVITPTPPPPAPTPVTLKPTLKPTASTGAHFPFLQDSLSSTPVQASERIIMT